ncbi:MAG: SIR2 family NAD-dependent protein deacylase [Chloroflexota bacterium]
MANKQEDAALHAEEFAMLADAFLRGECVLFVGAGVSAAALPKWSELVALLSEALPELQAEGATPGDFLDIAQWYVEEHGREQLLRELVRIYGGRPERTTELAEAVAALPSALFFTTNYDQILEAALRGRGDLPDVVVDDRHIAFVDERYRTTVIKLHGSIVVPESVVLTREDYVTYGETHKAAITYLQSQLATRTFLFVGFSFADPNFRLIYEAIQRPLGGYRRPAYALILDPRNALMLRHWERRGVRMLTFAPHARGQRQLLRFVRRLGQEVERRRASGLAPQLLARLADEGAQEAAELAALLAGAGELMEALLNRLAEAPAEHGRGLLRLAEGLAEIGLAVDAGAWEKAGDALLATGEPALALRAYAAAIRARRRLDEESRGLVGKMGRAYLQAGDPGRAETLLRGLVRPGTAGNGRRAGAPGDLLALARAAVALAAQQAAEGHAAQAAARRAEAQAWLRSGLERGLWADEDNKRARALLEELAPMEGE